MRAGLEPWENKSFRVAMIENAGAHAENTADEDQGESDAVPGPRALESCLHPRHRLVVPPHKCREVDQRLEAHAVVPKMQAEKRSEQIGRNLGRAIAHRATGRPRTRRVPEVLLPE